MPTYKTISYPHRRDPIDYPLSQARALRLLLAGAYGPGTLVDIDLVRAWASIVAHWPPAVEQDDQPEPCPSS